jgi:hypothetical protein
VIYKLSGVKVNSGVLGNCKVRGFKVTCGVVGKCKFESVKLTFFLWGIVNWMFLR